LSPIVAYLLYGLFAVGAAGLYLALPQPHPASTRVAGLLLGLGAIVGGLILLGARAMDSGSTNVFFYIFAAIAIFTAARVVTHPKPVYSAVYFVAVVVAVAALLVLQHAEFLAVAVIIIYAGAILVTYVFVIMMAQQTGSAQYDTRAREPFVAVLVGFASMAAVAGRIADPNAMGTVAACEPKATMPANVAGDAASEDTPTQDDPGNTVRMGRSLLGPYVIALEVAGVLLLVAMIGAIALVKKKLPAEARGESPVVIGQVGKEVKPF